MLSAILLENISKSYGDKKVFDRFYAVVPISRITCIMGPSGKGKTTLLHIIAGLENIDGGKITGIRSMKKSMVFQEDRICTNLTAASNIKLVTPDLSDKFLTESMKSVGLFGCFDKNIKELSGGMRRRISILRALLADYDILLMDEPFKGLDTNTRTSVIREIKRKICGRTMVMVTHHMDEAKEIGAENIINI